MIGRVAQGDFWGTSNTMFLDLGAGYMNCVHLLKVHELYN